jgi:hypothetical protein
MSNEVESGEVKVVKTKSVVIKEIISAIIGAAISFAVTFGLITTDQEAEIKGKMQNINTTAIEVVEMLKKGDVVNALAKANQIVADTNTVTEIAKQGIDNAKEKAEASKEIVKKATSEIKEAAKK